MAEVTQERRKYPILGSKGATIDWQLVVDHGRQAYENHYQSVERLAERGGLSWDELYAVLNNQKWQKVDQNEAIVACRSLEAKYLAAIAEQACADKIARLQRERDQAVEALRWYAEQGANCRKLTNEGELARANLDRDGGGRARTTLAAIGAADEG